MKEKVKKALKELEEIKMENNSIPKTSFDKLIDFLELDKASEGYRNEFLRLLDEVIEEEMKN